jgi:putative selenium metabolism hydrolase
MGGVKMEKRISDLASIFQDDLVRFLRDIISIPSVCGNEKAVIERIQKEMKGIGYDEVWIDSMGNLFGKIGQGKRVIVIDGHCDTVDVGDTALWEHPPYEALFNDGVVYGRGASDQKGGLASAVYAGKILKEIGIPGDVSLVVVASVLEEDYEGLCWRYIIEEDQFTPDVVILTEPTNGQLKIGQRGRLEIKVSTKGVSCHGSAPDRGENAIYKIAPIIQEIESHNQELGLNNTSELGIGSITVTDICSKAPSLCAIPDSSAIHLDRRLTEGDSLDSVLKELSQLDSIKKSQAELMLPEYRVKSHTGLVYPTKAYYPMWLMNREHPLIQFAVDSYQRQFGEEVEVGTWIFSTNGVVINGVHQIPTIGYGPGKEEHAHTVKDQVQVKELVKAMTFYSALILDSDKLML